MQKTRLLLLKVGGGLISDKEKPSTAHKEYIASFAKRFSELRAEYTQITVVYLLNAAGVLNKSGEVIATLSPDMIVPALSSLAHDVTAGIDGKIASARKAAMLADEVYVASGKDWHALSEIMAGRHAGTRIL
jgi:isopentenyl phosphate kinase